MMLRPTRRHAGPALPLLALAPALGLLACGGRDGSGRWATTMDTLPGGTIRVVNIPPDDGAWAPTWRLEEELRIGAVDAEGPRVFGQVKGLAVTSDGRIAVLDDQAQELRIFGPDGSHLATFGGRGGGPGEMEGAYGLMLGPGDSLWVPDVRNARMSVFDPHEGFGRSSPMPFMQYRFVFGGIMTLEGRVWKLSRTLSAPERPIIRIYGRADQGGLAREVSGIVLESDFALLDSLPLPAYPEYDPTDPPSAFYYEAPGGLPRGYISVPYFADLVRLLDLRGVVWSTTPGDPSYRIARWIPGGDTTLVLETHRPLVPVTEEERDEAIAGIRESLEERGFGGAQDWSKIPEVKPAVLSMFASEEGRLWVEISSPDSLRRYDVYERDGTWSGAAATDLRIWRYVAPTVRDNLMWAVTTDELGVSYVVRARIVPADPPH